MTKTFREMAAVLTVASLALAPAAVLAIVLNLVLPEELPEK